MGLGELGGGEWVSQGRHKDHIIIYGQKCKLQVRGQALGYNERVIISLF